MKITIVRESSVVINGRNDRWVRVAEASGCGRRLVSLQYWPTKRDAERADYDTARARDLEGR